jgi:phosphoribosyl 1,2-cyclic phosphate phosphodiesterase
MQLIDAGIDYIDAVLYTHEHADHIHGIDDLRQIFFNRGSRIDAYISDDTYKVMGPRFDYCFATPKGSSYPPIMKRLSVHPYELVRVCGKGGEMIVMPIKQLHGHITSIGYRFGNFAYTTDLHGFPDEAVEHLANLDVWVIDALRYSSHPSHLSVSDALQWIEKMQPKQAFFTNMHHDLDYETLKRELPAHVAPAYDGLSFTL